jgi:hypothetical protein
VEWIDVVDVGAGGFRGGRGGGAVRHREQAGKAAEGSDRLS